MSKKQPNKVRVKSEYVVEPEEAYSAIVTKAGTGASIKSFKKFIGREALVILKRKSKDNGEEKDIAEHAGSNFPSN
jgi:putative transposon-encoded protein